LLLWGEAGGDLTSNENLRLCLLRLLYQLLARYSLR
jgi:hypothetical protein